ncbi:MAG: cytochrome c3 family protein [Gammaproteobacteria bacterium]|nr:cytochrome c3 family protein [Gammaproteobacteria bacterium]
MVIHSRRAVAAVALLATLGAPAFAAKIADVANTKHNLSASGPGTVKATTESQICVFCHTPHKANAAAMVPLWNRALSTSDGTYTLYTSDSIQATLAQPDGSSKLCLSCHDGTMALGSVGVLNGLENQTIALSGTDAVTPGTMPDGAGAATGFTRDLGTTLTNDHPISFTFNSALAGADGELVDPGIAPGNTYIMNRTPGATRPHVPLENDKLQCVACHDPHIRDDTGANAKFLRLNRFQEVAATGAAFDATNDQVCLGCHDKAGWEGSAHANSSVADETYAAAAATQRDFTAALPVWKAGCLNCHDTHTVQGARRLLREGTDGPTVADPITGVLVKNGGNPALEETCYQCHDDGTGAVLNSYATVPNIKTDFTTVGNKRMPITSADQPAGSEVHAITDKDFSETTTLLGTTASNRHVECTDCHNPHRVIKNRLFNANPTTADAAGTHTHDYGHTNIASGVLAGTTGVEPVYGATTWGSLPTSYDLKQGSAAIGADTAASNLWLTREYQLCLKCHSDNAWTTEPALGSFTGGTPLNTNGLTNYTNQAMEFQAPLADKGEPGGNHRSWHPVIDNTGRTAAVRANMNPNTFLAPWNDATGTNVGNQTMYCSDCHGSNVTSLTDVIPDGGENGNPWGPHGSSNNFILKGTWDQETGATSSGLCFKCHDWNQYANQNNGAPLQSGFRQPTATAQCAVNFDTVNMHIGHAARIGAPLECTWCHVAVPHGWKNKQLLIDTFTDANPANCAAGTVPCTDPPYILEGYLGGSGAAVIWQPSGNWTSGDCGGRNWMNNVAGCANPL